MSQKNVNKFFLVFSLVAVALATTGCGTADTTEPTTNNSIDTGAAITPDGTDAMQPGSTDAMDRGDAMTPGDSMTPTSSPTTPASNPPPTTPAPAKSSFKDGTYTAEGSYVSPGGTEGVTVTLTLKNDVVTDVKVVSGTSNPMSIRYQGMFIDGIKDVVVGKKITELNVKKVSGSSLTSGGFNQAVSKIEVQAKNS